MTWCDRVRSPCNEDEQLVSCILQKRSSQALARFLLSGTAYDARTKMINLDFIRNMTATMKALQSLAIKRLYKNRRIGLAFFVESCDAFTVKNSSFGKMQLFGPSSFECVFHYSPFTTILTHYLFGTYVFIKHVCNVCAKHWEKKWELLHTLHPLCNQLQNYWS